MLIARTRAALDAARRAQQQNGRPLALVPTMGALHDGHLSLVDAARAEGCDVAVSIFVNPLQFDNAADLARYPADPEADLAMLERAGCAIAWLPDRDAMYPAGHATFIEVAGPSAGFEGAARPGHFRGVATVVATLFGQVRPATAWFGEKDWQQLQVIRRMTTDLLLPVSVRAGPILRAADGLALSSRNRFLAPDERAAAPALHRVLVRAAADLRAGDRGAGDAAAGDRGVGDRGADDHGVGDRSVGDRGVGDRSVGDRSVGERGVGDRGVGAASDVLARAVAELARAGFAVEYLALVDGESLAVLDSVGAGARLLAAARLGTVRLLDNIAVV